jgi:hypothetical protein
MLVIKFKRSLPGDGGESIQGIECDAYEIIKMEGHALVNCLVGGLVIASRTVGSDEFDAAYVENSSGKTIASVRASDMA